MGERFHPTRILTTNKTFRQTLDYKQERNQCVILERELNANRLLRLWVPVEFNSQSLRSFILFLLPV